MTVYAVADIEIHDRDGYRKYESGFMEIFKAHQGRLLAVDEQPHKIEGTWRGTRIVLMSFPDQPAF